MITQRTALAAGLAIAVCCAGAPAAASAASEQTITALGSAQAKVHAGNSHNNAAIVKAVDRAYKRSVPAAIADAREDAQRIAAASGLTLGAIESVDENVSSNGGYYGPTPFFGAFGPNQYCAVISRRFHTRDRAGRLHTRTRKQKVCHVPEFAFSTLAVTFAATPAPAG
jgi:uncharacterized protein YggE